MIYKINKELMNYDYEIINFSQYAVKKIEIGRAYIYKFGKLCVLNLSFAPRESIKNSENIFVLPENLRPIHTTNINFISDGYIPSRAYIDYLGGIAVTREMNSDIGGVHMFGVYFTK